MSGYLAVLQLGILGRFFGADAVPHAFTRTDVMVAAAVLYAIEFVTDKIPYLDNAWDAVHTIIRPTIGAGVGLLVAGDAETLGQAAAAATGGLTALLSHVCKASARLVVNLSPEPFTNITASLGEDVAVAGVVTVLVIAPWAAATIVAVVLAVSVLVVWRIQRRVRRGLSTFAARRRRRTIAG